jgi:hypothetical protein
MKRARLPIAWIYLWIMYPTIFKQNGDLALITVQCTSTRHVTLETLAVDVSIVFSL